MHLELWNNSKKTITVNIKDQHIALIPGGKMDIPIESDFIKLQLMHEEQKPLNIVAYILNDLFTHERFRATLVVDGEYIIKDTISDAKIKINDHEYVISKDISYRTFVFNSYNAAIDRKKMIVANWQKFYQKARFLYLFGSTNALFSWSTLALIVVLIGLFASTRPNWWLLLPLSVSFIIAIRRYISFMTRLKKAANEKNILEYMASKRKEQRTVWDCPNHNYVDNQSQDEIYW